MHSTVFHRKRDKNTQFASVTVLGGDLPTVRQCGSLGNGQTQPIATTGAISEMRRVLPVKVMPSESGYASFLSGPAWSDMPGVVEQCSIHPGFFSLVINPLGYFHGTLPCLTV